MKRLLKSLGVLLVLVAGSLGIVLLMAGKKVDADWQATYDVAVPFASAEGGDLALGERIVKVRNGCAECHGPDLSGATVIEDPAVASIYGTNITPHALASWSDGEIARAVRSGVNKAGRAMILMPSNEFATLSEGDLKAVVSYLRSVPPVAKANRESKVGPMMKALYFAGKIPVLFSAKAIDHKAATFGTKPAEGPTMEFGKYLVTSACIGCHGAKLEGGPIPGAPPDWAHAANLTKAGLGKWDLAGFVQTMKTGVNPGGKKLAVPFPLALTSQMSDVELQAMWKYLETL